MISDLLNVIAAGKLQYQDRETYLTIRQGPNDCTNYNLQGYDCDGQQVTGLACEISWNPIEYSDETEKAVNSQGKEWVYYKRKRGRLTFSGLCAEVELDALHKMSTLDDVRLIPYAGGVPDPVNGVQVFDMTIEATDAIDAIRVVVGFAVEDTDLVVQGCCGSPYETIDYEPCPLPADPNCAEFTVQLVVTEPLPFPVTMEGQATTIAGEAAIYTWFSVSPSGIRTEIGQGSTIQVNTPGRYEVRAVGETSACQATDDIFLVEDCASLTVGIQVPGGGILVAETNVAGGTYAWSYIPAVCPGDPIPPAVNLPDTGPVIIPTEPGQYTVSYDLGPPGCQATSAPVNILGCSFYTGEITRSGNDLTVNDDFSCGTPAYTWEVDYNGDGTYTPLPDTTKTITITENGSYRATVSGDVPGQTACDVQAEICIFELCQVGVNVILLTQTMLGANVVNCGAGPITYSWEQQLQPGPWEPFDGDATQPTIMPTFYGNYRVTVTCGGCQATSAQFLWVPPSISVSQNSQLFVAQTDGEFQFTVTNFNFDPAVIGTEANDWRYSVYRNGQRITNLPVADIETQGDQTTWSRVDEFNLIQLRSTDPLYAGDWILIVDNR